MAEVPLLKTLHDKYATQGLVILGVSVDSSVRLANRTIKEKGMIWPQLVDARGFHSEAALAYRVDGTPTVFVLDRAGKIVARPSSARGIEQNLAAALK
jgi:peroxiredoxin